MAGYLSAMCSLSYRDRHAKHPPFAAGLRGPRSLAILTSGITWNIQDWELS